MFRLIMQYIQGNVIKIKDVREETLAFFTGAIPLYNSINQNVVQSKHNIFKNVKFATCFLYK